MMCDLKEEGWVSVWEIPINISRASSFWILTFP
jgi:hypothetical protein